MNDSPWGSFLEQLLNQGPEVWNEWVGYMLEYKSFLGSYTFDEEVGFFRGRVANVRDLISFEGKSHETVRQAFKEAVDTYLEWCQKHGREVEWVEEKRQL